jgi:hypothetical protein
MHAPTEDKDDDIKDNFYEELERVFDQFPRYHMKILLAGFTANVGRELVIRVYMKVNNDNGIRVINFATSKICQEYNISTPRHS